ncbi:T9SS type A sorting domain-containing protein [candidate division KSB1 bacterium]|nr:T9SS type A sorting domain-containing protein [candidate division KSB1 bacterium]
MKSKILLCVLSILYAVAPVSAQVPQGSPKNIILMISDGWGDNQIKATDYYEFGETGFVQVYQKFPVQQFMSTYMSMNDNEMQQAEGMEGGYAPDRAWTWFDYIKLKPTDSAASATAMATGKKTYKYAISVDIEGDPLETVVQRAEKLGKATGVVSSVQWTHATPACFASHNNYRNNYAEIGQEMVYNSGLDVIMGAGHPWFDDNGQAIATPNNYKYVGGETTWNDLVAGDAGNDADGDGRFDSWALVQTKQDFEKLTMGKTPKRVLGTAQVASTLQYSRSGQTAGQGPVAPNTTDTPFTDTMNQNVPSLATMTAGALNVLDNNPSGLFLMVEGGAVDWAGHGNTTARLIEEQIDFNLAVEAAVEWVNNNSNWDETLIIVTGDHETGFFTGPNSGPDDVAEGQSDALWTEPVNKGVGMLPETEWHSGDHTNQLIPLFARGAGSDILDTHADEFDVKRGTYLTNSEIGQTMMTLWPDPATYMVPPKNIVLMISDGWGLNQVIATDYYQYGAKGTQSYENWPVQYYMSTFMALNKTMNSTPDFENPQGAYEPDRAWTWFDYVKQKPTDSAASGSAFSTGVKTYKYSMGLDARGNKLENIVQLAEKKGKATGVVSSVQWTHATPAAMAVHNIDRNDYTGIGKEMVYYSGLDVIMGAGHPWFDNDNQSVNTPNNYKYVGGTETWNELVGGIAGNDADADGVTDRWHFIDKKRDFEKLVFGSTPKRVLGTAQVAATLQYNRSGQTAGMGPDAPNTTDAPYTDALNDSVPSLQIMTAAALNVLDNDRDGFFLMVEGGAVDWAGHGNTTARLIEEQIDFNHSVDAVIRWVNANSSWDETLVIVTGDHETGYFTGPGSGTDGAAEGSETPVLNEPVNNGKGQLPGSEWHSGDHTNQLIPLYAKGAGSRLFEQFADQYDEIRGYFTDNAEVGQLMLQLMKMNPKGDYIVPGGMFQLLAVRDVPNDQGRQVRLTWNRHPLDDEGKISSYSIYRKIDPSLKMAKTSSIPAGQWDYIIDIPAIQQNIYHAVVPTLKDSSRKGGMYSTTYFVKAQTTDPSVYYSSAPMSGCSVDNLSPQPLSGLFVNSIDGGNYIGWNRSSAGDLANYRIFRASQSSFVPNADNLLVTCIDNNYIDKDVTVGTEYYYAVVASDFSGNESSPSRIGVLTGVEDDRQVPSEFNLAQNFPNPFNPTTKIDYSIPRASRVNLTIFNTLGQKMTTLVNEMQAAGNYSLQWNAVDVPSGTYLYKLEADNTTLVKKMQLLK